MERYSRFGPMIAKIACVLLTISLGFTIFVVIEVSALSTDQLSLENLSGHTYSDFACFQLCVNLPNEQAGKCCEPNLIICQTKFACYQSKISEYQTLINQETDFIDYFSIPAVFFLVSFLIAVIYFLRLKKKSQDEERLLAIREAMLAIHYNEDYDDDFQQFENYNAFLQFMMEQDQSNIPANEKKGDSRITDSFATNDDTTCPICMMEYREQKVLRLRCHHKFHSSCIRDWNQANSSCPVCRGDIYQ